RSSDLGDPRVVLAPALEGASNQLFDDEVEALARHAERIERAALDERLHRALVEHERVDASDEVVDRLKGSPLASLHHDAVDEALAHVAHGGEPEDDLVL